ncbi:peptidyl-prolyl cis-trans isomerase [Candidatus Poribacteria bacterium]|nr:peptidyl-prolyl cis-trans isomerase [Candidatus Poribacteria bacterium]
MIVFLREKFIAQIFLIVVGIVFIIGSFLLFDIVGGGGALGGGRDNPVAFEINGVKIQQREFENLVSGEMARQQQQSQNRSQIEREEIEQQVLDLLISRQVLLGSVQISNAEVEQYIRNDDNLLSNYNAIQQSGNANDFREYVRSLLINQVLLNQIQGLELVTDAEVENEYRRENTKAKLKYIEFQHFAYNGAAKVDDAEAQTYFETHKDRYEKGEEVNLRFIKLDPQNFISGEDLQAYYNENQQEFKTPEVVKARHILKKFPDNATDEQKAEVKTEAEKLLETVKAAIAEGEDFAELAKKHSEDTGSAPQGGALRGRNPDLPRGDYFARGDMVQPFEKAAFDELAPGEVSDLVESRFGYHIIKLEEKRPEEIKPFAEARSKISDKLIQIIGAEQAKAVAENLLFDVEILDYQEAIQLDRYKDLSLTVQDTGFFAATDNTIPKIGGNWTYQDVIDQVFDMEVNISSISTNRKQNGEINAYFVVKVLEKKRATVPEFETVKAQVIDDLKGEKAKQLALEDAQRLVSLRVSDESLEDLVKKYEAPEEITKKEREVEESKLFDLSPNSGYISGLGTCRDAMFAAFEMELNEVANALQGGGAAYIIQLVEREEPDMEKFENDSAERAKIRRALLQGKQTEIYRNWLATLKKSAQIVDKRAGRS